jgi:hypothetical protein
MCPAGQPPQRRRNLLKNFTNDRLPILTIVNAKAINPEDAQTGYAQFDKGTPNSSPTRTGCWRRRLIAVDQEFSRHDDHGKGPEDH